MYIKKNLCNKCRLLQVISNKCKKNNLLVIFLVNLIEKVLARSSFKIGNTSIKLGRTIVNPDILLNVLKTFKKVQRSFMILKQIIKN
jgi:hypothetical protein